MPNISLVYCFKNLCCVTPLKPNPIMKRKILKALLFVVLSIVALVAIAAGYVATFLPDTGTAEIIIIERTPERIERERYLANYVASCMDCHSQRD